jgi:predicted O-methyltransferase YrrM
MDRSGLNDLNYIQSPARLDEIIGRTKTLGFDMASEPRTGALLQALAASKSHGRILELGTGTGIAWLLSGMDREASLTSVDNDALVQSVAREFLGADHRLNLILKDALQFLNNELPESYDLVFADAMPGKYKGLRECLRVVKPGGNLRG